MEKKMKRRLGWIVIIGVLLFTIALLAIGLISARTRLVVVREELMKTQYLLGTAEEGEQIEALILASVVSYAEGDRKAAVRFLEYAIYKMADRERSDLGLLPAEMLKDPQIARKLGLKRGSQTASRRFGGG